MSLYSLIRPLLFSLDAETAHRLTLRALDVLHRMRIAPFRGGQQGAARQVMGLRFPNPIGLAAGLDKDGRHIDALAELGFGFLEIGTVTPRPQPGNPRPRMFRLPDARAIINRMGFNNAGVEAFVANVQRSRFHADGGILGLNIGKNADTPIERAADDYLLCLERVYRYASYVTVNISSPNTKNLRQLQGADELDQLLGRLRIRRDELADQTQRMVPIALKIAPDLDAVQIQTIADAVRRHDFDAVIATNTTIAREAVHGLRHAEEAGGLSGAPVLAPSNRVLGELVRVLPESVPVIGVGGVLSGADARAKFDAGAALVQLYSGLIYRGPDLIGECIDAARTAERRDDHLASAAAPAAHP